MRLYAIARRRGAAIEFYHPLDRGNAIGWTAALEDAWCIERPQWAEAVRDALMRRGHFNIFVHVFTAKPEGEAP